MENYRLTQTGEEVQEILNGAAMQTDLTAENERAEGAEQTLQGNIDDEERRAKAAEETLSGAIGDEELRAKAAEETLGDAIDGINAKIPAAASSENKLADQDFVNSSIETATATFRGTYNLVSDLHLAVDATHAQIATLLGTVIAEADNNDYSYVLVPTSASTPTEIASIEKYTFGANGWAFAYALNNSGFTSAQWAAINSGITSGLVAKLNALPTNTDLLALLAGKQDVLTFDDVPVEGSNNPVKSGGVHSAIDDEKTARVNAVNALAGRVDTIEGEIPAQASSENQLADKAYVNSSISTSTATYRGSFNLVADLGLSVSATHEQIGTALAGEISTADNNDYAYVQVPTSDETPSQILKVERYKFNGTAWAFEYELNNSGFTSAQWAAINSGITSGLVGKLNALPTNDELTLALAGKQDVLTFDNTPTENSNNPVKSGGVYAADKALSDAIEAILLLIPSAATSLNKLVDTDLMNSSISTATATFRGTFNLVSDLSLDLTATHAQIATALAGAIATADNNDYCFVQIPTAVGTPTEIASTDRYKFNGTAWAYEYTLNTSGFTSAQWAAINSGITAALVASLADIPDLIPSEATSANQLADKAYVLAQILAATPAFKGQFVTLAELQAVASPKAGDLGIVRTKDSDGMDVFTVYQYLNNAWNVFYSLSYHPQTKPATTGTTGDYPYNGMGRVELAMNMVNTGTELAPVMVNQLTQDMFYKGAIGSRVPNTNTIFVIRYDYVLGEDITIPDNCILEFDGGSISGDHSINFQGLKNTYIYTSWLGIDTLHKSIKYMSYKTLVVDTVLELSTPLTNRGANSLFYFTITGVEDNNYEWAEGNNKEHSKIICNNCSAIDIYGWCNFVKNLSFTFSSGGNDNPFIILDTQGAEVSDLDSGVYNCFFNTDDHTNPPTFNDININNAIVTYGRGLVVQGCLFNGLIKDSYVKCLMKHDNWRPSPGIEVSDKYGGRAFWINHNRLHMGTARLVHFAVNQSAPDCTFRGIRIENNIADIGGSLGLFDAKSYNTVITNNTFLGGVHGSLPFLTFTDGNEIEINNNVFRGYDNEDLPSGLSNNYLITIGSTGDEIKSISVCNNIASPIGYFIMTDCNIDGINICDNIMNEQAFTASSTALLRALKTTKNAVVKNNINNSPNDAVPAFRAWDNSYPNEGVDNISIADNLGFVNWITSFGQYTSLLNGRSFTNVNIKYDKGVSPDSVMDACSYAVNVKSKTGFSYINTVLYPVRLAIWSGAKWIERDSASLGVARSGSFASRPADSDVYVGFKYFCTDKQTTEGATNGIEIIYKGSDVWVDALGRVVS